MRTIDSEFHLDIGAHLPDPDRESRWVEVRRHGASRASLLEGPAYEPSTGDLYLVDVPWGRLIRVRGEDVEVVHEYDGEPNGLAFHRDGRLFVADSRYGILAYDTSLGTLETVCDHHRLVPFVGVNDLVFDDQDNLYFTDQGLSDVREPYGAVFRLSSTGELERLLDGLAGPNGIALDHTGSTLFIALTAENSVARVALRPDGAVNNLNTYVRTEGGVGPDGMAVDAAGNLLVTHPGRSATWVYAPDGELLGRIRSVRGSHMTNVAVIPDRPGSVLITEARSASLLTADLSTLT